MGEQSMKALKTTIALGLLVSMPVQAEVVCKDCTYSIFDAVSGLYLGGYWPGDRGSFNYRTQFLTTSDSFWVIDLNANGTLVFTAATPAAEPFVHFRAELYRDVMSDCNWTAGGSCPGISLDLPIITCTYIEPGESECRQLVGQTSPITSPDGVKRWTIREPLVAGRYVLRVIGQKGATPFAAYTGRVALRK